MNGSPPTILLATDGSPSDAMALRATSDLAVRGRCHVHVVTVLEPPRAPWTQSSSVRRAGAARLLDEQRARLEEAIGRPVDGAHLKVGHVVDATLALVADVAADLVVLGDHGLGVMDRFRDHVAEAVAARSPVPVLLVRGPEEAWPPHRVVIGHNGSPEAAEAAAMGSWVADVLGLSLLTAVVLPPDDESAMSVDAAVKAIPPPGTRWSTAVVAGEHPARVLAELCRGEAPAVLLCVGARGSGALRRDASASVSADLLRHARFPLLLVPPPVLRHHVRWVTAAAHVGRRHATR